ncbi:T2R41 protein, partial [Neodrepanis coruscans]|nr:T2R41 protein [Neodrepanis coruscans]
QEKFSLTSYDATSVAIITLEVFAGMWINAFLVSVLCMAWVKKKTLNSNEKILLVLGFSRFGYLCISWINSFFLIIYPNDIYVHPILQVVTVTQKFLDFSDICVSACLCVFYCLKIANFRNSFFIYLKAKIDGIVPWLLLGSVFCSLIIGILVYIADKQDCNNSTNCNNSTSQGNFWKVKFKMDEQFLPIYFIIGFVFVTSFMAVIFSALLLLFSLWRHKQSMQTNSMTDLSMDAHIRAMKSILSFFIMYNINLISLVVTLIYSTEGESPIQFLLYAFLYAFPGVHSLVLIFSNSKLENILLRILHCVKWKLCMK